jgi:spore germination protein YaaH
MNESKKNLTVDPNLLQAKPQVAGGPNATVASDECFVAFKDPYRPKRLRASVCPWLFILILAFGVQSASAQTVWSEGTYYPDAESGLPPISAIPWSYLTHVDFVGGAPQSGGSITLSASFSDPSVGAAALITAAHAHSVKVNYDLTNVGSGTNFTGAMTGSCSSGAMHTFVTNIMSTVNSYGFDGVMVDNEESYSSQYPLFMSCLRTAMGTKLIEVYIGANYQIGSFGYPPGCTGSNWPDGVAYTVSTYADRVLMATYDLGNPGWNGAGEATWFNSALYSPTGQYFWSVDYSAKSFEACTDGAGHFIPASKLSVSIPFYGDLYTINTAPYQTTNGSSTSTEINYADILATYGFSGYTQDSTGHVPWKAGGGGFLTWEDAQSITDKINYVYTNHLGGWMLWVMGQDYTSGSMPLLTAVGAAFHGGTPPTQPQPPTGLQIMLVY